MTKAPKAMKAKTAMKQMNAMKAMAPKKVTKKAMKVMWRQYCEWGGRVLLVRQGHPETEGWYIKVSETSE